MKSGAGLLFESVDLGVALGLAVLLGVEGIGQALAHAGFNLLVDLLVAGGGRKGPLGLAATFNSSRDAGDQFLAAVVAELDGIEEFLFGRLAERRLRP